MSDSKVPPGFVPFTKGWHTEPYPLISSTRPELSARGKNIVITGGGTGIGQATAVEFAKAGAKSVTVVGRRKDKLEASKSAVLATVPDATVLYEVTDLVNLAQTKAAFASIAKKVGKIDVLVSNAGAPTEAAPMAELSAEVFSESIAANVITALHAFQAFLPNAGSSPTVLSTSTGMVHIAPWAGAGAYPIAKAAGQKLTDYMAAENPHVHFVSVHPGWVPSAFNGFLEQATDTVSLPASFFVWLASPEAAFLRNKYVWANWDAQELLDRAEEIKGSRLLTWGLEGVAM